MNNIILNERIYTDIVNKSYKRGFWAGVVFTVGAEIGYGVYKINKALKEDKKKVVEE